MKYCQNCGASLDDSAKFCIECGAVVEQTTISSAPVDYSSVKLISNDAVLGTVRQCASSPLFLISIIAFTVATLFGWISSFIANDMMVDATVTMNDMILPSSSRVASIIGSVIGAAPSALLVIGMWMTYASAKGNNDRMKTSGLAVIRVVLIIFLVLMCICAGLVLILIAIMSVAISVVGTSVFTDPEIWSEFGNATEAAALAESMFIVVAIIAVIVFAAFFTLAIIYFAKLARTVKVIKTTIETGTITGKASAFVAVMAIILGGFTAIAALSALAFGQFYLGATYLLSALTSILFGALLFSYRNKMASITA